MKGGTALNLFVQDMPRLSVDIDVVFTDHGPDRAEALRLIGIEVAAARKAISAMGFRAILPTTKTGDDVKLLVSANGVQVKIEINFVFRGTVMPVKRAQLSAAAQELFTTDLALPMLDSSEIYGSKLVAAMDRQHPRDMFDVMKMLEVFGWQSSFVDCFVAYLAGHNRPVHEVLFPKVLPLEQAFTNEFSGMTRDDVDVAVLRSTQAQLISELPKMLTSEHKEFLLSLTRAEPDWKLLPFAHLQELPAIQWKLMNLRKLRSRNRARFDEQYDALAARFPSHHAKR